MLLHAVHDDAVVLRWATSVVLVVGVRTTVKPGSQYDDRLSFPSSVTSFRFVASFTIRRGPRF